MIGALFIGLIVGIVAKFLMPGKDPGGFIITTLLGIAGAGFAHWLGSTMDVYQEVEPSGIYRSCHWRHAVTVDLQNDFRKENSMTNKLYFFLILPLLVGCQNPLKKAVRNVEYSAYELVGVQKRDLLKTRLIDVRDDQQKAGEEFQDALTRLRTTYGSSGSQFEKQYDSLKASYDRSQSRAEAVHKSVKKVENVAKDLFDEWDKEIDQIETQSFKQKSRQSLKTTQTHFSQLLKALNVAESKMDVVLKKLKDYTLFMKHNLNAQAIDTLKKESDRIQVDIDQLKKDMDKSIEASQQFIDRLNEKK